jgi:hypothetical protein
MRRWLPVVMMLAAVGTRADAARAGEYPVYACSPAYGDINQSWVVTATTPALPAYGCSHGTGFDHGLVTRLSTRAGSVGLFAAATMTFRAPPGTSLTHMQYDRDFCGASGFRSGLWTPASGYQDMAGPSCSPRSTQDFPLYGGSEVHLTTACSQSTCSTNVPAADVHASMTNVRVWVNDPTPPSVWLAGGTIQTSAWQAGVRTAVIGASDATGVAQVDAYLDGVGFASRAASCDFTLVVPCRFPGTRGLCRTADTSSALRPEILRETRIHR